VALEHAGTPWLTVVTVVKNDPAGFATTVDSLAAQDLSGVEYVVVDSSADSTEVLATLAALGEEGRNYAAMPPRGIYPAMNAALEMATGEYVYFLNAGDTLHRDDVLARVHEALSDAEPTWAFGPVEIVGQDGRRVVTPPWDYAREKRSCFSRGLFPPHQGTFVRRTDLRDQGGFEPGYTIVADYASFLKLSLIADPLMLDPVIATFTEGGVSTRRWHESLRQFHQARRRILVPKGSAAVREYANSLRQGAAVAAYRRVVLPFRRAR
jgi:glycosyltransferase involved in cell wall biosynthesis